MNEYTVTLAMRVKAETPADAAAGVVGLMVDEGLTKWTYIVQDGDSDAVLAFLNGKGEPIENPGTSGPTTPIDLPTLSTPVTEIRRVETASSEDGVSVS